MLEVLLFIMAFGGLAFASEHLCNSMETLCERWRVHEDVGGATFIALGNAIPEITINCISTFKSMAAVTEGDAAIADLGIGAILGSGLIAYLLIPASCTLLSEKPLIVRKRAMYRDGIFYLIAVLVLASAVYRGISAIHAPLLVGIYICYVVVLVFSDHIDFFWNRALGHPHLGPTHNHGYVERDTTTVPLLPLKGTSEIFDLEDDEVESPYAANLINTFMKPLSSLIDATCPDCRLNKPSEHLYGFTFVIAMCWISLFSFIVTVTIERWVALLNIPGTSALFGLVLVAVGAEIPDSVNAVTISRRGYGGMAISACLGSQVINICLGLGMPWLIATLLGKTVPLSPTNWFIHEANILLMLSVVFVIFLINKMGPMHAFGRSEITRGKAWTLVGCYAAGIMYLAYSTSVHHNVAT